MALTWPAKAPADVIRYSWPVPVLIGDQVASYTESISGAIIDASDVTDNEIVLYVSGGTEATTATVTLTAFTTEGETFTEKIYIPIISSAAKGETAGDIIDFALRPVVGIGGTASADEQADALEWLNGMLGEWGLSGAEVGATFPLTTSTVLYVPNKWLLAIKTNLRAIVSEQYGRQVSPFTARQAALGLQALKFSRIPAVREAPEYF